MTTVKHKQADKGLSEVFKYLTKIGKNIICEFALHLEQHLKLSYEEDFHKLPKSVLLDKIKLSLMDKNHETFEIVFRWIELNQHRFKSGEKQAIENKMLSFALEQLFSCRKDGTPKNEEEFYKLLYSRNLGTLDSEWSSLYESLSKTIGEPIDCIRKQCVQHFKLNKFPLDSSEVKGVLKTSETFKSHISALESSDDGDPFIFYAASIVYQLHIHVISAALHEEYVFYPSSLPSKRAGQRHIYIGHLYGEYYTCLTEYDDTEFLRKSNTELNDTIQLLRQNSKKDIQRYAEVIRDQDEYIEKLRKDNLELKGQLKAMDREKLQLDNTIESFELEVEELKKEKEEEKERYEILMRKQEEHIEILLKENLKLEGQIKEINKKVDSDRKYIDKNFVKKHDMEEHMNQFLAKMKNQEEDLMQRVLHQINVKETDTPDANKRPTTSNKGVPKEPQVECKEPTKPDDSKESKMSEETTPEQQNNRDGSEESKSEATSKRAQVHRKNPSQNKEPWRPFTKPPKRSISENKNHSQSKVTSLTDLEI